MLHQLRYVYEQRNNPSCYKMEVQTIRAVPARCNDDTPRVLCMGSVAGIRAGDLLLSIGAADVASLTLAQTHGLLCPVPALLSACHPP